MPRVQSIYIAPNAGLAMTFQERVNVLAGKGIVGDRYASGLGAFSRSEAQKIRDISLITRDGIDAANHLLTTAGLARYLDGETRRNIIIEGMSMDLLNLLVGKEFYLGGLRFRATELCVPCGRPSKLTHKSNFEEVFSNKGGIRAQVLDSGRISCGDLFTCLD